MPVATPANQALPESSSEMLRVEIATRHGEYLIVASEDLEPGEWLMTIDGMLVSTPCRYSVQVARHQHIAPPVDLTADNMSARYLWRFLNHSCRPNTAIVRRVLIAIKPIAAGEEITFDYNTNEYEMAAPFTCRCGHCDGGQIRGYRYLTDAQRRQRAHRVGDHLRDMTHDRNA